MKSGVPFIEAIIRVSDDSFESRLTIPVSATPEQLRSVGTMWMEALLKAVRITEPSEPH